MKRRLQPYSGRGADTRSRRWNAASYRCRAFNAGQTRETDLELFVRLARVTDLAAWADDVPFHILYRLVLLRVENGGSKIGS